MKLITLDQAMKSSRIDSVAEALRGGPTPQGIAEWLLADDETRRSLALLFKLASINAKDEINPETGKPFGDTIAGLDAKNILQGKASCPFWDVVNITPQEIQEYLKAVQGAVGTDPGVVRLAYTIFRALGFAHENGKFVGEEGKSGLWGKHWIKKGGDLTANDIAPFVYTLKDPKTDRPLVEIIRTEGMRGLATALNRQKAEELARRWSDMNLILDAMDKIADIRSGSGGGFNIPPEQRLKAIKEQVQELGAALAKRKLSQETFERIIDPKRISRAPAASAAGWGQVLDASAEPLRSIRDIIKPSKKPSVKG